MLLNAILEQQLGREDRALTAADRACREVMLDSLRLRLIVPFRIVTRSPKWLEWLIIQNTNAYEVGFTAVWDGLRGTYWKSRTPETEKPLKHSCKPTL